MTLLDRHQIKMGDVTFDVHPKSDWIDVTIGKEHGKIKYSDLFGMVFTIADPKRQEEMMPVRQTEVMRYRKVHAVQLKKDMHKGEIMKVRCETDVPLTVVEGLRGLVEKEKKTTLILPK